jgi:hypothetical protein
MTRSKIPHTLSMVAIVALLSMPASAAAAEEAVVPPSNSAAAQYTEAFPTSGGDKKTDQAAHHRSPLKVLGSQKTRKLEEQGQAGREAAEVAAATAPNSIATPPAGGNPSDDGDGSETAGSNGANGKGDGGAGSQQRAADTAGRVETATPASDETGSSGIGSTIGQATGLSTAGSSGVLLPLMIVATVLWSLAYLRRQRRRVD